MDPRKAIEQLAEDASLLLESEIESRLGMTYEQRIEAHENARRLMADLREAGEKQRAESQGSS